MRTATLYLGHVLDVLAGLSEAVDRISPKPRAEEPSGR